MKGNRRKGKQGAEGAGIKSEARRAVIAGLVAEMRHTAEDMEMTADEEELARLGGRLEGLLNTLKMILLDEAHPDDFSLAF